VGGRFAVESVVARGGFGVVYRAVHTALQMPVALKVLHVPADISDAARERFLALFLEEARIIAQVQHPAIVRPIDYGVLLFSKRDSAPWMVLEWLDGRTLAEFLRAHAGAPLTPAQALAILPPVIEAIAVAHERGVVHRDLKPSNIMLPRESNDPALAARRTGRPRSMVLDFGIAKVMYDQDALPATGQTHTHSSLPTFTPRYAAPEQASGARTGPWTDVTRWGCSSSRCSSAVVPTRAPTEPSSSRRSCPPCAPPPPVGTSTSAPRNPSSSAPSRSDRGTAFTTPGRFSRRWTTQVRSSSSSRHPCRHTETPRRQRPPPTRPRHARCPRRGGLLRARFTR